MYEKEIYEGEDAPKCGGCPKHQMPEIPNDEMIDLKDLEDDKNAGGDI
jgi:hypothetical protein